MSEETESGGEWTSDSAVTARRRGGVKLTDRDRDVLGLLVLARYLTAAQVHCLAFAGRHPSLAYRRLLRLSREEGQPASGSASFGTMTAIASPCGRLRRTPCRRRFRAQPHCRSCQSTMSAPSFSSTSSSSTNCWWPCGKAVRGVPRAAHPAFRWVPSDRVRLVWGEWEMREGRRQQRVIQPDAVLEVPRQRRRYFLECEMGTHTIAPKQGNPPGATLAKADRYQKFLADASGLDGRRTHYDSQYPDGFAPEVLFLVLGGGRAASVNAALASWRKTAATRRPAGMRGATFSDAAAELRQLAGLPAVQPHMAGERESSARHLSGEDVAVLRQYFNESRPLHQTGAGRVPRTRAPRLAAIPGSLRAHAGAPLRGSGGGITMNCRRPQVRRPAHPVRRLTGVFTKALTGLPSPRDSSTH